MPVKRNKIKVFVASTVYNFEPQLDQIYELLDNFGYDVLMSHKGTIPLDSTKSNLDNCISGVNNCDVFIGFIRPSYGTGVLEKGTLSITHQEFATAIKLNIPRFILADSNVVYARQLFNKMQIIDDTGVARDLDLSKVAFKKGSVLDIESIHMYNMSVKNDEKPIDRKGNWIQEYKDINDIKLHLDSQFKYTERIKNLIQSLKTKP